MIFDSVIITHNGRYYHFTRQKNNALECQVCYWKGAVLPPHADQRHFRAYVEQKYAPYQQIWAEGTLKNQSEALKWVAQQLSNDKPVSNEGI